MFGNTSGSGYLIVKPGVESEAYRIFGIISLSRYDGIFGNERHWLWGVQKVKFYDEIIHRLKAYCDVDYKVSEFSCYFFPV